MFFLLVKISYVIWIKFLFSCENLAVLGIGIWFVEFWFVFAVIFEVYWYRAVSEVSSCLLLLLLLWDGGVVLFLYLWRRISFGLCLFWFFYFVIELSVYFLKKYEKNGLFVSFEDELCKLLSDYLTHSCIAGFVNWNSLVSIFVCLFIFVNDVLYLLILEFKVATFTNMNMYLGGVHMILSG